MSALTDLINAYIRRNANQEITGPILNGVLLALAASAENVPYIGENGDWYLYDTETGQYADSGHSSTLFRDVAVDITEDGGDPSGSAVVSGTTLLLTLANIRGEQGPEGPEGPAGPAGVTSAVASIGYGTVPAVATTLINGELSFMFSGIHGTPGTPGAPGAAAGFGTPTATVDANTGTPSVQVAASGPDTAKVFAFTFKNLKGAQGNPGTPGTSAGFGTPTASVDANTGTPSVAVTASGPDTAKVFDFAFHNLKGATGSPGSPGAAAGFGTPTASVDANVGTPSVVVTPSGPDTAKVFDFAFHNLKGAQGNPGTPGAAAGFGTPTASVDANVGTPSVVITSSGPDTAKVFDFAFHNLKGEQGVQGVPGDSCAVSVGTAIPAGGMKANNHYALGTITTATAITLDTTTEVSGQMNIYSLAFLAGSPAPTITWPAEILRWAGNCLDSNNAPVITAGNSYEVSIVDGLAVITEFVAA